MYFIVSKNAGSIFSNVTPLPISTFHSRYQALLGNGRA